jgi:hypothetical protein
VLELNTLGLIFLYNVNLVQIILAQLNE